MQQLVSKIVEAIIEKYMADDESYKGKSYSVKPNPIIPAQDLILAEKTIEINSHHYKFIKCANEELLKNEDGVYIFVAKEDFSFSVKDIFLPFASLRMNNGKADCFYACTPKINFFNNENPYLSTIININKGELIYVGETKELKARYNQHISDKINRTSSLKLGLRKNIQDNVDFYYTAVKDKERSNLEKTIRDEFCPRFGK